MSAFLLFVFGMGAFLMVGGWNTRRLMRHYWQRRCTGTLWRRQFPAASKNEIREFLNLFVEAFGFSGKRRLCFAPGDQIMEVYRSLYAVPGEADSMELEDLVALLEDRYGVKILSTWRQDVTLGELFLQTRGPGQSPDLRGAPL